MHHQLDFVIQIVDAMTDASVIGGSNQFWIGGQPIRPTKITETFFVFSNILNDPRKVHVYEPSDRLELTWHNSYYQEIKLIIETEEMLNPAKGDVYYLRALPSAFYPFKQPVTGFKGKVTGANTVRLVHQWNQIRYHLTGPAVPGEQLLLSQSFDRQLNGKTLQLKENENVTIVKLEPSESNAYYLPLKSPSFSEEAEVLEVLEVPVDAYGLFFFVLPTLQRDFQQAEVQLTIASEDRVGYCKATLLKDQIVDIGHFDWEELEKE